MNDVNTLQLQYESVRVLLIQLYLISHQLKDFHFLTSYTNSIMDSINNSRYDEKSALMALQIILVIKQKKN